MAFKKTNLTRHYSPETGRFLSEDPIGFFSLEFNFYRYVESNPLKYADPVGLDRRICHRRIRGLLGTYEGDFWHHSYVQFRDSSGNINYSSWGMNGMITDESGEGCGGNWTPSSNVSDQRARDFGNNLGDLLNYPSDGVCHLHSAAVYNFK